MNAAQRLMIRRLVYLADQTKEVRFSVYTKRKAVQTELSSIRSDIAKIVASTRNSYGSGVGSAMSDQQAEETLAGQSAKLRSLRIVRGELEVELVRLDQELEAMAPDQRATNTLAERVLKHIGARRDDLRMLDQAISAGSLGTSGGFVPAASNSNATGSFPAQPFRGQQ